MNKQIINHKQVVDAARKCATSLSELSAAFLGFSDIVRQININLKQIKYG